MKVLVAVVALFVLSAGAAAQTDFSEENIRSVEQELVDLGYDTSTPDGKIGWRTSVAIWLYQSDWQLPATGKLTTTLIERLERKHVATEPGWQKVQYRDCEVWNSYPLAQETVTWTGECVMGITAGEGRLEWSYVHMGQRSVAVYRGEMLNGRHHGHGSFTWPDGEQYIGEYVNGEAAGQGVYKFTNGSRYEGNFKEDKFNGHGVLEFANGDRYEGEFGDDMFNGHGVFSSAKGNRYEGGFVDNLFSGQGVFNFANGDRYKGAFENDRFHGKGLFTWSNGNSHEGEYRVGKPHGFGVYFTDDVETMRGNWHNGCLNVNGDYRAVATTLEACGYE